MSDNDFPVSGAFPESFMSFGSAKNPTQILAGNTQGPMGPPAPPPTSRRLRRESSFLVFHPRPQPAEGPDSGRQEPQTPDDTYIYIEFHNVTVEAAWDDVCCVRVLFYSPETKPRDWIELLEHERDDPADTDEPATFTIRVGQDRPSDDGTYRGNITSTITNAANFGKQAADRPNDWYFYVTALLTVVRNAAHQTKLKNDRINELTQQLEEAQDSDGPKGFVSSQEYAAKSTELRKLQAAMTRLQTSRVTELTSLPAYKAAIAERDATAKERDELKLQLEDSVTGDKYERLFENYKTEKKEADSYYNRYWMEVAEHKRTKQALEDKDKEVVTAQQLTDKAILDLQNAQRESKTCLDKLLRYEPSYQPYSFLSRERHEPIPPRRPQRDTSPIRDPRDARASRDRFFQNMGNSRPVTGQFPTSPQAVNPFTGPPAPGGAPHPHLRAEHTLRPRRDLSTWNGPASSYKMPDIKEFCGEATDDYERWRETAVDKCASLPDETYRIAYLKQKISGNAWPIIKKMKVTDHMDYLDALDGTYLTYDQFGEAETSLMNGGLRQKQGETFAAWQARFLGVANILHTYPQRTLIKKARGLMNTRLGNAMATVPNDNETLSEFLRRARSIDEASQDVYTGKATATATSSATKTRRHAPGDRSPERKQRSNRHVERKVQDMRTAEDKRKCREHNACYKCGKAGHTQYDKDAPCRGKPITPSSEIPFLAALTLDGDETEEEEINDVVADEEEDEDDDMHF
ncbi:hypothetical protein CFE70_000981 [Pyrenophora teres f. teres 0-1]